MIIVEAAVQNETVEACVDTGAGRNYISSTTFHAIERSKNFKFPIIPTNFRVHVANSKVLVCNKSVVLPLTIHGRTFPATFLIVDSLLFDVIIGCKFLIKHAAVIDLGHMRLKLRSPTSLCIMADTAAQKLMRQQHLNNLMTTETIIIPPLSEILVPTMGCVKEAGTYIAEPRHDLTPIGVFAARGILEAKTRGKSAQLIGLANFTTESITIPKDVVICSLTRFDEKDYDILKCDTINTMTYSTEPTTRPSYQEMQRQPATTREEAVQELKNQFPSLDIRHERLNLSQLNRTIDLFSEYKHLFEERAPGDISPEAAKTAHTIETGSARPVHCVPRRYSPAERQQIQEMTSKMLAAKIIRPSRSPWSSPVVLSPKKDGGVRFCVDYRKVNESTVRDVYPLPRIDDCLSSLGGSRVFSIIDLKAGYWQIPVEERDKEKTAFVTHAGLFEFNVLPFGLTNAPATFQRFMDKVFSGLKWQELLIYMDDITVHTAEIDQQITKLKEVFQRLNEYSLVIQASKCHFFCDEFRFLGHIVDSNGMRPDRNKTEAIAAIPVPKTMKQLRSFVGMTNYYRSFINNYTKVTASLISLVSNDKKKKLIWNDDAQFAFENVKSILSERATLYHPDFNHPFVIQTDASDEGLGAILCQRFGEVEHVVQYASRSIQPSEMSWTPQEKEALAIIWACQLFRPYVYGAKFIVETDHKSLKWLLDATRPPRLVRWALMLAEFDFEIQHRRGRDNANADALSRLPSTTGPIPPRQSEGSDCLYTIVEDPNETSNSTSPIPSTIPIPTETIQQTSSATSTSTDTINSFDTIITSLTTKNDNLSTLTTANDFYTTKITNEELIKQQRNDPGLQEIIDAAEQNLHEKFIIEKNILYRTGRNGNNQLVIPWTMVETILSLYHNQKMMTHPSRDRLFAMLKSRYFWPKMYNDVNNWVNACLVCRKAKPVKPTYHGLLQPIVTTRPFEIVGIDILGPLKDSVDGYKYVLVCVDLFTSWVEAIPLRIITADAVLRAIFNILISRHGCPETLLTDQGRQFTSSLFNDVCKQFNIKNIQSAAYHHQTNGKVERFNAFIESALRTVINPKQTDWSRLLPHVLLTYRVTLNRTLAETPFYLIYGRDPKLPQDLLLSDSLPTQRQITQSDLDQYKTSLLITLREAYEKLNTHKADQREKVKEYYDKTHKDIDFAVGSLVMIYSETTPIGMTPKLTPRWSGPFEVLEKINANTYRIKITSDTVVKLVPIPSERIIPFRPWIPKTI